MQIDKLKRAFNYSSSSLEKKIIINYTL